VSGHDDEVLGKAYDARLMRRLIGYLKPYRSQVAMAIAAIIGHSVLELTPPYLTKVVIDRHIPAGDLSGLAAVAAIYAATLVGSFGLEYLQMWTMQLTGQRIMFDLRMQLYGHLQRLDLAFYDRNPVGRLMTRVTTDVDVLNELFTSGVVSVFGDVFTLFGIMAVLVWMDWRLALVAFAVLPLIILITQWLRRNVRESGPGWRVLMHSSRSASPGWPPPSCSDARAPTSKPSTRLIADTGMRTSSRFFTTPCFIPRSN
jgi:ATP-binding cassette subfamily B multidrug efflux pump